MSTDVPQAPEGAAAAEIAPRKRLLARIKPSIPDWRPAARRAAGAIAAVAAVGAVLGGLVGFWSTYKVVVGEWFGQKPAVVAQTDPQATAAFNPPRLSIALLPFDNLSGDASQDYLGDGIVENLTTDLSVNVQNLLVIARGSSFSYKGQKIDPRVVGRELNAKYLLQGSVQRTDTNVRINVRLVDAEQGQQLWAERFDGDTSRILAFQDQITARISNSLKNAFVSIGGRQSHKSGNPDVFDLILRAQSAHWNERRLGVFPRKDAPAYYRRVLAIEPDNVDATTGLGLILAEDVYFNWILASDSKASPEAVKAKVAAARELLDKGLRLNPVASDAHLGRAHLYAHEKKWTEALRELERARTINPNNAPVLFLLATTFNVIGAPEKAVPVFEDHFLRTAGKTPAYRAVADGWGRSYLLLGRWADAIEKYEQAQAIRPLPAVSGAIAAAYANAGDLATANVHFEIWRQWATARSGPPTIKRLRNLTREYSDVPAYLKMMEATLYAGYRKLGVPEE